MTEAQTTTKVGYRMEPIVIESVAGPVLHTPSIEIEVLYTPGDERYALNALQVGYEKVRAEVLEQLSRTRR